MDAGWCINEYHCSVQRIAEEHPAICDQELQVIRMTFRDCRVERVHWRLESDTPVDFRSVHQANLPPNPKPGFNP